LININTKNILFVCGGAFVGLDEIIRTRLGKKEHRLWRRDQKK